MLDYYAILGVEPSVDLATLKQAFRIKVRECHPDRGGTHERMVLVNEAWQILSDPDIRQRYDEALRQGPDSSAENKAAADANEARRKAEANTVTWDTVDSFLNDFTNTTYSSQPDDNGWFWPTANSATGWGFITGGSVLGLLLPVYLFQKWLVFSMIFVWVIGGWMALFVGAWIGVSIHRIAGVIIHQIAEQNKATAKNANGGFDHSSSSESRIIICSFCQQKLRVPVLNKALTVRCNRCGQSFTCQP
jgi:curved DNA-binding protein CbpA